MPNNEPTDRQLWFEDLKTYRQHENWAAGLAFAGIALVTNQLVEWKDFPCLFWLSPATVGFIALIHLRMVNFRGWAVRRKLQKGEANPKLEWSAYATLMALWPVLFGSISSLFLLWRKLTPSAKGITYLLLISGLLILVSALAFWLSHRLAQRARTRWIEKNESRGVQKSLLGCWMVTTTAEKLVSRVGEAGREER